MEKFPYETKMDRTIEIDGDINLGDNNQLTEIIAQQAELINELKDINTSLINVLIRLDEPFEVELIEEEEPEPEPPEEDEPENET